MISTDPTYTGAGTVTPPAVGLCTTGRLAWTAPTAAPVPGTGLPVSGSVMPFRLRGLIAAGTGTATGACYGAVRPSVQQQEFAVAGVLPTHTSSTPGDLPPEDPLS